MHSWQWTWPYDRNENFNIIFDLILSIIPKNTGVQGESSLIRSYPRWDNRQGKPFPWMFLLCKRSVLWIFTATKTIHPNSLALHCNAAGRAFTWWQGDFRRWQTARNTSWLPFSYQRIDGWSRLYSLKFQFLNVTTKMINLFSPINTDAEKLNYSICWYINIHNCVYWNTWSLTWWKCNIGFEIFSSVQTVVMIRLYYANGHFTKMQVIKWQQNVAALCHFSSRIWMIILNQSYLLYFEEKFFWTVIILI